MVGKPGGPLQRCGVAGEQQGETMSITIDPLRHGKGLMVECGHSKKCARNIKELIAIIDSMTTETATRFFVHEPYEQFAARPGIRWEMFQSSADASGERVAWKLVRFDGVQPS